MRIRSAAPIEKPPPPRNSALLVVEGRLTRSAEKHTARVRALAGHVSLAADYRARTRIVYVETSAARLFAQNRGREAAVPEKVIRRMTTRWEVPSQSEAHEVVLSVREHA